MTNRTVPFVILFFYLFQTIPQEVQLDKALELFLNETYNKDDDIRDEVMLFSRNKEVQAMLLDEDFARLDWNSVGVCL